MRRLPPNSRGLDLSEQATSALDALPRPAQKEGAMRPHDEGDGHASFGLGPTLLELA